MRKRIGAWIFLVFSAACTLGMPRGAQAQGIRIGVLLPLSGPLASVGILERQAFRLALRHIHESGGIGGRPLELVFKDTQGIPQGGIKASEQILSGTGVAVLTGGCSSRTTWEVARQLQARPIPFLITTASDDRITEQGWDYVFRLASPAGWEGRSLTSFFQRVAKFRKTFLIYEDSPWGHFGLRRFKRMNRYLDLQIVGRAVISEETSDPFLLMRKALDRAPDLLVLIASGTRVASILKSRAEQGIPLPIWVMTGSDLSLSALEAQAGEALEHAFTAAPWAPTVDYPGAWEFHQAFLSAYGVPPDYHGAQAYAAMQVLAEALKAVPFPKMEALGEVLRQMEYSTVFGPVRFEALGKMLNQNRPPTLLIQWIGSRAETVWPLPLASARFVSP